MVIFFNYINKKFLFFVVFSIFFIVVFSFDVSAVSSCFDSDSALLGVQSTEKYTPGFVIDGLNRVNDTCVNSDVVTERYCPSGAGIASSNLACDAHQICGTFNSTDPRSFCTSRYLTCIDSDNSSIPPDFTDESLYVKGNVISVSGTFTKTYYDKCTPLTIGNPYFVNELFCDVRGAVRVSGRRCLNGDKCIDGRCVEGSCIPEAEVCGDLKDNDCDGNVDEGIACNVTFFGELQWCGDGICQSSDAYCPQDVGSCPDDTCFEPVCGSINNMLGGGCNKIPVAVGSRDEGCANPNVCDGGGNCVACEINEIEPNDDFTDLDFVNTIMRACLYSQEGIIIRGSVVNSDVDVFKIPSRFSVCDRFDVDVTELNDWNPAIGIFYRDRLSNGNFAPDGETLIINNHRNRFRFILGPDTALPLRESYFPLYLAITQTPTFETTDGNYEIRVRKTHREVVISETQRVLLDFDGATNVVIGPRAPVDTLPMEESWLADEYPDQILNIKNLIKERIEEDYAGYGVEIYTTDVTLPEEPYTTVYFGAFDSALLGVAEGIDEYNAELSQKAIVFTENFAVFETLNPDVSQISYAIANVASHETGHLLGLVHTDDPSEIMDVTASLSELTLNQNFKNSDLHPSVFPIGKQNAPYLLWLITKFEGCPEPTPEPPPPPPPGPGGGNGDEKDPCAGDPERGLMPKDCPKKL